MSQDVLQFDTVGILASQQNRYPLLFIDKILEAVPGKSAVGLKNFTFNEWFFPAHYEDEPNVPGFILVEAMVQTFIMTFLSQEEYKGSKTSFLNLDDVKFRRQVLPGDSLIIKAELQSFRRGMAKGYVEATVDGDFTCSGQFTVSVRGVMEKFIPNKKS